MRPGREGSYERSSAKRAGIRIIATTSKKIGCTSGPNRIGGRPPGQLGEMTPRKMPVFSRIFAREVDGRPTLTFEARNIPQSTYGFGG